MNFLYQMNVESVTTLHFKLYQRPITPTLLFLRHVTWFELHELSVSRVHLMSGQELRIQYERNNSYTADVHRGLRPQIYP